MKKRNVLIAFLLIMTSIWYIRINKPGYEIDKNKVKLSHYEARRLYDDGVLNNFSEKRKYWSEQEVKYYYKRSLIPLIYNKDTVSTSKLTYYSKEK